MRRAYLAVEGHGDGQAALNLVHRLAWELGLAGLRWADPIRGRNLHQERGVQKAGELVRHKSDAAGLLLLRDEDDGCPRDLAPVAAGWLQNCNCSATGARRTAMRVSKQSFRSTSPTCSSLRKGVEAPG